MVASNLVAQLRSVRGGSGSGDVLEITALDSGIRQSYSGTEAAGGWTYDRTVDTATFAASSQYYATWTSDAVSESAAGFEITYQCGNATWRITGAGADVAAALEGKDSSSGAARQSLLIAGRGPAAVAAVVILSGLMAVLF